MGFFVVCAALRPVAAARGNRWPPTSARQKDSQSSSAPAVAPCLALCLAADDGGDALASAAGALTVLMRAAGAPPPAVAAAGLLRVAGMVFVALAVIMLLTRKLDWYGLEQRHVYRMPSGSESDSV